MALRYRRLAHSWDMDWKVYLPDDRYIQANKLSNPCPRNEPTVKFICLMIGIFFTALGVAIYLQSEIAPNPLDRTMLVIDQLTGWGITYARALINIILVIAAFLFSGAIGIGTLINALFSGMAIQYLLKYIKFSTKATAE